MASKAKKKTQTKKVSKESKPSSAKSKSAPTETKVTHGWKGEEMKPAKAPSAAEKDAPKLSPMQQKEPKTIPITKHLKVQLTEAEIKQLGHDAARYEEDATKIRKAGKLAAAESKTAAEELESKRAQALASYAAGFEFRDVDCNEIWDYQELIVRTVRLDTGVEILRRNMTRDELQLPLPQKKAPVADGTEKMSTAAGAKVSPEATKTLKETAVERMNEDGDRTASELRSRKRKQEQLLDQIDSEENRKTIVDNSPPEVTEDGEIVDDDDSIDLDDLEDDDDDDDLEEDEEEVDSDDDG
jgi:RNA polymerase primary sigma factor